VALLLGVHSWLAAVDLVFQRAVVRRHVDQWRATAGQPHRRWDARAGRALPRHAFRPAPPVDSAVQSSVAGERHEHAAARDSRSVFS